MSDYIIRMDIEKINPNPLNKEIYGYNKKEHEELKKSIEICGLLDPLTITRDNLLLSGHRRLEAVKEIGWTDVDCRLTDVDNIVISLVEMNRHRVKTTSELLNEAEVLKEEYGKMVKMGRPKKGEEREGRNWTILSVAEQLGTSTTNLKKLMSIKKYEPELLNQIDLGIISTGKAYRLVRERHILNGKGGRPKTKTFVSEYEELLNKYGYDFNQEGITDSLNGVNGNSTWSKAVCGIEINEGQREINDFYPTNPKLTRALLDREILEGSVWEPACGEGDMSKVLNEYGYDVFSSDLIDRGYGEAPIDFLDDNQIKKIGKYDVVMTNPPFCNGKEFVLQAKKVARKKICILNKTLFIDSVGRYEMWLDKEFPLKTMYQIVGSLPFRKNNISEERKGGLFSYAWYVFEKGYVGKPSIKWIPPYSYHPKS
jgi:hypothetical protein